MLKDSGEKHDPLKKIIQDIYFETSPDGTITEISSAIEDVSKYTQDELIGTSLFDLFARLEESDRFLHELLHNEGELVSFESLIKDKDKFCFYCRINAIQENDSKGKPLRLLGTIRNITQQKEAEKELQKKLDQLHQSQKMETLGTLVAGMAHEINNPINLIIYNTPLLKKVWHDFLPILHQHFSDKPDYKFGGLTYDFLEQNLDQLLSDVDMAAHRIAKIVTDLKNFSRQSSVSEKRPVKVNEAVKNGMRLIRTTLKNAGIKVSLDLAPDLPLIEGSLQNIEQIILNIIINAIQAIDHDKGFLKISTGIEKRDKRVVISISDNGKGINPALADRLFEPFVTDKQAEGGTGLGLSVTYSLIKAHDGEILFKTNTDNGTTFTLLFPTILQEKAARILVVDDDDEIRELLSFALTSQRPYLVNEASNGIEACIKLGATKPDLLVLDIFMPDMNGLEVCRAIKNDPGLSDIKVVITTGFPDHTILTEVNRLGFTNVLYKPIEIDNFLGFVDNILEE